MDKSTTIDKPLSYVEVALEGYPRTFTSANDIISAKVTLGQNDKSSACTIVVADSRSVIAADLIRHSLASGGLQKAPKTDTPATTAAPTPPPDQPNDSTGWTNLIVKECIRQGVTDQNQIAYILATAEHESSLGSQMVELASGLAYEGKVEIGNTSPGDGRRYKGRGLVQVTGKNNYRYWSSRLKTDFVAKPDAITRSDYAVYILVAGMKEGRFTGKALGSFIGGAKVDLYGARTVVNGYVPAQAADVNAKFSVWQTKVLELIKQNGQPTANVQPKVENSSSGTATPDTAITGDIYKGHKLTVSIGGYSYDFFHVGTTTDEKGTTTIQGQGTRWVLNRRKRNKTAQNIKLSELAAQVAKSHGLTLNYQAKLDPIYSFISQSGISDYELLRREADACGLFVSEEAKVLTIKSLLDIRETAMVVTLGVNVLAYSIKDKAVDSTDEDAGTALSQSEQKIRLNPITGQFEQMVPDVDTAKSQDVTGKDRAKGSGKVVPGTESEVQASQSRVKRVKGLPSTFVVPLTEMTLSLKPLDAIRTKGFPDVLSRVWLLDSIEHDVDAATSTLSCYSPVEVIDTSSSATTNTGLGPATASVNTVQTGKMFVWPTSGTMSSPFGPRAFDRQFHDGLDIAAPIGTKIIAPADGTMVAGGMGADPAGYGNFIELDHGNGIHAQYGHVSAIYIKIGQKVKRGDVIAAVGNAGGRTTGAHLHWRIRSGRTGLDPCQQMGVPYSQGRATVAGDVK